MQDLPVLPRGSAGLPKPTSTQETQTHNPLTDAVRKMAVLSLWSTLLLYSTWDSVKLHGYCVKVRFPLRCPRETTGASVALAVEDMIRRAKKDKEFKLHCHSKCQEHSPSEIRVRTAVLR